MTDQSLKLASEFPPADYAAWRKLADAALNGAPFDKKLVTHLRDGFDVQPIYTADDLDGDIAQIHPTLIATNSQLAADARTSAGANATVAATGWDIRQLHAHPAPKTVNDAILEDLESGVTSILLRLDHAARFGRGPDAPDGDDAGLGGVMIYKLDDLNHTLNGVYTNLAPIALDAGAATIPCAALLAARMAREDDVSDATPAFNLDPIGTYVAEGFCPTDLATALKQAGSFARAIGTKFPHATAITVNSTPWYNAGATDSRELAIALATGLAYFRAMVDAGMEDAKAATSITFTTAIGTDFFAGIAKLRALRLMWRRILQASGIEGCAITLNAVSAEQIISKVDPWVNMLRTTVTSFAAGLGGADSVVCLPYDHAIGLPDGFSRRIARNTQLILQEESNVHRVIDPAGGAWFIENLTRDLAQNAWRKFQEIETAGGIITAIENGTLTDDIATSWHARADRLATRRDPLTGVSEFPNIDEAAVACDVPDISALRAAVQNRPGTPDTNIGTDFNDLVTAAAKGASIKQLFDALYGDLASAKRMAPLPRHRLSEAFEANRLRASAHTQETGKPPQIFLCNIGKVADHTARAMFARNFFGAGGIETLANNGFATGHDAANAFRQSGAKIAIICGSDTQYAEHAAEMAKALNAAGASKIYLAGHPGDNRAAFEAAGISEFIFVGSDVVALTTAVLDHLGVK
jgi:methylmalonyl-CoA mutase